MESCIDRMETIWATVCGPGHTPLDRTLCGCRWDVVALPLVSHGDALGSIGYPSGFVGRVDNPGERAGRKKTFPDGGVSQA